LNTEQLNLFFTWFFAPFILYNLSLLQQTIFCCPKKAFNDKEETKLQIPDTPSASDEASDKDGFTLREHIPKYSKFSSAVAEGDINMKKHNWEKALNAYTKVHRVFADLIN